MKFVDDDDYDDPDERKPVSYSGLADE